MKRGPRAGRRAACSLLKREMTSWSRRSPARWRPRRGAADRRLDAVKSRGGGPAERRRGRAAAARRRRLGCQRASSALLVPLVFRGRALGVLPPSTASAAGRGSALTTSRCCARSRRAPRPPWRPRSPSRRTGCENIDAAERERRRWARELHDETLQGLGGLQVLLSGAARSADPDAPAAGLADGGRAGRRARSRTCGR